MGLGDLYNNFKNLLKQFTYTKTEIDSMVYDDFDNNLEELLDIAIAEEEGE